MHSKGRTFSASIYVKDYILTHCTTNDISPSILHGPICMHVSNTRASHLYIAAGDSYSVCATGNSGSCPHAVGCYLYTHPSANTASLPRCVICP